MIKPTQQYDDHPGASQGRDFAVNEVENLTNGLSRKIWQKIMILDRIIAPAGSAR